MTSIADRIAGPPLAGAADAIAVDAAPARAVRAPTISFPVVGGERELRLDLFRGLALWLIFIDHLPPNLLTWFTIRNYGFSDATEIFIFISGYTAAFVYGRAMLESGFVVATARILRRVWQIYVAHVFLFTIFLAEISYVATSFENATAGTPCRAKIAPSENHGAPTQRPPLAAASWTTIGWLADVSNPALSLSVSVSILPN